MQTRTYVGIATAATAGFAGTAMATDVNFSHASTGGGDAIDVYFLHDGAIDEVTVDLTFTSSGDFTWAGDVTMALISPNGTAIEWGGYDTWYGYDNAGDFPAEWDVSSSGSFSHTFDISSFNMEGDGEWQLAVMNGYGASTGGDWTGTMSTTGCDTCPDYDCNENGIEDAEDISGGTSEDCDLNGIPDECEADCNNNGIPDACDPEACPGIAFDHTSAGGAVIDEIPFYHSGPLDELTIELEFTNSGDFTWAGDVLMAILPAGGVGWQVGGYDLLFADHLQLGDFPAEWDVSSSGSYSYTFDFTGMGVEGTGDMVFWIANGYSGSTEGTWTGNALFEICTDCIVDCNGNEIADADDIANGTSEDCNSNGRPDECDIADGETDANSDGIPDSCQLECGDTNEFAHTGTGSANGGVATSFEVEHDGGVSGFKVSGMYTNDTIDATWAGDVLIAVCDPSGNCVEFGGYDDTLGYEVIGDFPAEWDSPESGEYLEATFSGANLSGAGTWTVMVMNGWTTSAGATWDLDLVMCGVDGGGGGGCDDDPDLNGDGCVSGADVGLILSVWAQPDPPYGDLDCDGDVDGADFGMVLAAWSSCP